MASPSRSPHLLHADEEQLDRAATMLRTGTAFVIAVAPKDLWPAALGRLRAKVPGPEMPPPIEITEAWAMLDALVEQTKRKDRVLSLTLAGDVGSALDGLNLHREKTLKGGPVLLWLEGVDALMHVRERAPDAFSFRATMVALQGDGGVLPVPSGEEPEEVTRLRRRLKRAKTPLERARLGQALAEHLRARWRLAEAETEARTAWNAIPPDTSESANSARTMLCWTRAQLARARGQDGLRLHWAHRALAENDGSASADRVEREAVVRADLPGPFDRVDRASVNESLRLVQTYGLGPEPSSIAYRSAMILAVQLGDLGQAHKYAHEQRGLLRHLTAIDRANRLADFCCLDDMAGHLARAEAAYREALRTLVAEGTTQDAIPDLLRDNLANRGELDAASTMPEASSLKVRARLELERGDVAAALRLLAEAHGKAEAQHADAFIIELSTQVSDTIRRGLEAERATRAQCEAALADLSRAETLVAALVAGDSPPWYPIQFLCARATLASGSAETLPQALDLSRQALDLARKTYPDLLPETGRLLADHHLLAAQPDEALAAIADVEPYAAANGFLLERARLLSARLLAHVLRGDPPDAVAPHLAALREACAATDSPRITAETLRDLAKRLPPTCTLPDPYTLAEEAHDLFLAMPMPAQDARCMEIMGDVLLARADRDEARARYQMARGRLQRYGLGLRLPLLEKKLAALA